MSHWLLLYTKDMFHVMRRKVKIWQSLGTEPRTPGLSWLPAVNFLLFHLITSNVPLFPAETRCLKYLYTVVVTISGLFVAGKYHFLSTTILTDLVLHVLIRSISTVVAFGVAKVVRVGWMSRTSLPSLDLLCYLGKRHRSFDCTLILLPLKDKMNLYYPQSFKAFVF